VGGEEQYQQEVEQYTVVGFAVRAGRKVERLRASDEDEHIAPAKSNDQ
jgi:hypothetical protein